MAVPHPSDAGLAAARAYLEDQARVAHGFGSPFVAALLLAGARHLEVAPYTATMMAEWPGDRASAAVAMRFHSALHAWPGRAASRRSPPCFVGKRSMSTMRYAPP